MKFLLICCLALAALGNAHEVQHVAALKDRSISSIIVDAIEAFKEQMPCGFPGLGLPPLAPLKIGHQDIDMHIGGVSLNGNVNDFVLSGLNDFDVVEFRVQTIRSRVEFQFNFNHVFLDTMYEMAIGGLPLKDMGGKARFGIKNLNIKGDLRYSLGVLSGGKLRVKQFNLYVTLGEVHSDIEGLSKYKIVNRKLNELIEEWIMLAINDNTQNIADFTNSVGVDMMNAFIGDKTLGDLLGLVGGGGGGGGEGEEPVEKTPCVVEEL